MVVAAHLPVQYNTQKPAQINSGTDSKTYLDEDGVNGYFWKLSGGNRKNPAHPWFYEYGGLSQCCCMCPIVYAVARH